LAVAEDEGKPISTNKNKLLILAVQGQIAPAEPERSYATTWDGKPKMAIGIGWPFIEALDCDIQTTDPKAVEEFGLKKLRLGDLVAIKDHYDYYGNGRYEGAVTIGVCIHGWSDMAGHGPGLNPVLSALPGKTKNEDRSPRKYGLLPRDQTKTTKRHTMSISIY
jgi:hypothetical protein